MKAAKNLTDPRGLSVRPSTCDALMRAFDALPRRLRDRMNYDPVKLSAESVLEHFVAQHSEGATSRKLDETIEAWRAAGP